MFIEKTKKESVRDRGNELLRIRICYPSSEEYPRISEFYEGLADNTLTACVDCFEGTVRESFEAARAGGIPFTRLLFSLEYSVPFECEGLSVIALSARLLRGKELLAEYSDTQWWELDREQMIPPKLALREYAEWQKSFRRLRNRSEAFVKARTVFSRFGKKVIALGELKGKEGRHPAGRSTE